MSELTHLDLFSGIGGFSLAFEAEGFKTIGFSEIDPYASAVLKKHWPNVPNYGDVRNVPAVRCDVLTGGFPCQPFSLAGKRRGKEDDRHLWPAMLAAITSCQPAWVLGENVPGIIGMELDAVLSDLEGIGYAVQAFVVPACAVDARHRRDRVWIVGNANGERSERQHLPIQPEEAFGTGSGFEIERPGENVANTNEAGRGEQRGTEPIQSQLGTAECSCETIPDNGEQAQRIAEPWSEYCHWPIEPELGRVAHGIPNRSHRLKSLGNAIVPAVAQIFARAIKSTLK